MFDTKFVDIATQHQISTGLITVIQWVPQSKQKAIIDFVQLACYFKSNT
jgi:hypothetical protein